MGARADTLTGVEHIGQVDAACYRIFDIAVLEGCPCIILSIESCMWWFSSWSSVSKLEKTAIYTTVWTSTKKRRIELETMNYLLFVMVRCTIAIPCPGEDIGVGELGIVCKGMRFCDVEIITGNMQWQAWVKFDFDIPEQIK
jgi:hypothetical protein